MRQLIIVCVFSLALLSCKDEVSILGLSLQENQFTIEYDTIQTIVTSTKYADSLSRNKATLGLLGDYNDPIFGNAKAAIAIQVVPKSNVVNLGDAPVADSVVLKFVERSGYYGLDSAALHTVRVYRVNSGMNLEDIDSTVTNFTTLANYKGALLAQQDIVFNPNDTVPFSIKLEDPFAEELLDSMDVVSEDSTFLTYFPGLIVEAEKVGSDGNIITIDFNQDDTHLRLHLTSEGTSRTFDYVLNSDTYRYSIFDHQYEGTDVMTGINDSTFQQFSYIQSMNGVGMEVRIDGLDSLFTEESWAVNSALLTLRMAPESETDKFLPPALYVVKMLNDAGEEELLPDYMTSATETAPESYNIDIDGLKIRLNNLIYDAVKERRSSLTLTVYSTSPLTTANRAVVAGSSAPDSLKPILHIIRSK